jgi:hypothetical protein
MSCKLRVFRTLVVLSLLAWAVPAAAQQTGSVSGRVVDSGGLALPGVTVEARGDVLPAPRVTTTDQTGEYRLPALPPGNYTLTFTLSGMQTVSRQVQVQLAVDTPVNATLGVAGVEETITVTATASLVDRESATLASGVSNTQIMALPVGQEYRDLMKLIPAVQFTQDQTRGPSAGGSGQDNVYQFDGVNVTMPLFGTLTAEPSSHDIAQVTTIRGGARAVDFDRSGGFTIDTVSKSGTNRYAGELSYQIQNSNMAAELDSGSASRYEQDRSWLTANVGGPVIPERLFFYGSYYRPENKRGDQSNVYGPLPDYRRTRNEGFGKLTFNPTNNILLNGSYRDSERTDRGDAFGSLTAPTAGTRDEWRQRVGIVEGSWVIQSRSHVNFKWTSYALETASVPANLAVVSPTTAVGTQLNLQALDTQGRLSVPTPVANATTYNEFIAPLIARYGYVNDAGVRTGGGLVGYGLEFNDQDFFRDQAQVGYNITLGSSITHELHVGYQRYTDKEELIRSSNGWGAISVPGGRLTAIPGTGQSAFYTARYLQQPQGQTPRIVSSMTSQSFEINDTIRMNNWTFNAGVLVSNDKLYGQGLREAGTLSGFESAPGNKYLMHEVKFQDMIQPRAGATWAYNGNDTVYAAYARYHPAASSLPRAASWDRNLFNLQIDAHFDAEGRLFASVPVGSSSGKLFADGLKPRQTDEILFGTARQLSNAVSMRAYYRYREGSHFWEDVNNNARIAFRSERTPASIPAELYIPDLTAKLAQIGSGSTYVIAEIDGGFTEYHEATLEAEYRGARSFVRGSYTWSKYYGNVDQDNSTTANDANVFIGSSFIADGAGRQVWDFKEGRLRGDRPHMLKAYGFYQLNWNATIGSFFVAQSGQPWEMWSFEPYRSLTTSTSNTNRYAEPAGSRRADAHWQMDLKYVQDFRLADRITLQLVGDLYNVFNNQTGYNINPEFNSPLFGQPRSYFDPRRFEVTARLRF